MSKKKSLLIVFSYHHKNTEKIANVIAGVLEAQIKTPQQVNPEELQEYDLIGFGSGIYSENLHKSIHELVDKIPQVINKKAVIFSTSAIAEKNSNHKKLRKKLQSKGYEIIDEFNCRGFNTNSFMKFFGGMNKGRPNDKDLKHAEEFAQNLLKK
ncbi:MAG: flavodoxin [Asgard group archaeon]|nr:flavodoxin [Asgard group archaeon]